MELVISTEVETPHGGYCHVRIYEDGSALPVVVCTEPPDNPGMSITNAAEEIAASVLLKYYSSLFEPYVCGDLPEIVGGLDKPFVWIEHYPQSTYRPGPDTATFDLVHFSTYEPKDHRTQGRWTKTLGTPTWKPLDRETAETLVGQEL